MEEITRRQFIKNLAIAGAGLFLPINLLASKLETKTIMLDPGHGMGNRKKDLYDPGCIHDNLQEADLVLDYAKRTAVLLSQPNYSAKYDFKFNTKFTRKDKKTNVSLDDRVRLANTLKPDIFVSCHWDNSESSKAQGVRIYHHPKSKKGKRLARAVHDNLITSYKRFFKDFTQDYDGVRTADFRVLRKTKIPAILIEPGFLSNNRDRKIAQRLYPTALGITKGILQYFEE